jgi:predicted HD phosphohydrolase
MDLNRINKIFSLYEKYGDNNYIGERVSQIEHALQCSFLAEKENFPNHVILAAFLHDIG